MVSILCRLIPWRVLRPPSLASARSGLSPESCVYSTSGVDSDCLALIVRLLGLSLGTENQSRSNDFALLFRPGISTIIIFPFSGSPLIA